MKEVAILVGGVLIGGVAWFLLRRRLSPEQRVAIAFESWVINAAARGTVYAARDAIIAFVADERKESVSMRGEPVTIAYLREQVYVLDAVDAARKMDDLRSVRDEWISVISAYDDGSEALKELFKARDRANGMNRRDR